MCYISLIKHWRRLSNALICKYLASNRDTNWLCRTALFKHEHILDEKQQSQCLCWQMLPYMNLWFLNSREFGKDSVTSEAFSFFFFVAAKAMLILQFFRDTGSRSHAHRKADVLNAHAGGVPYVCSTRFSDVAQLNLCSEVFANVL